MTASLYITSMYNASHPSVQSECDLSWCFLNAVTHSAYIRTPAVLSPRVARQVLDLTYLLTYLPTQGYGRQRSVRVQRPV